MKTIILQPKDIKTAISLLQAGENIAIPTETVYGLAADALQPEAIKRIFTIKKRPQSNPLILHIANIDQLEKVVCNIPDYAFKLAKKFWPGPLTLVLPKQSVISDIITAGQPTIAVRIPDHPITLQVIAALQLGLVAPSANIYTQISPTTADHVITGLGGHIPAILDGGPCKIGIESTIVDCTGTKPIILREGMVTKKDIALATNSKNINNKQQTSTIKAPGQHKKHYSPKKTFIVATTQELSEIIQYLQNQSISFSGFGFNEISQATTWIKMPINPDHYAQLLYKTMHELDALDAKIIIAELPPQSATWTGIHDRLLRASQDISTLKTKTI